MCEAYLGASDIESVSMMIKSAVRFYRYNPPLKLLEKLDYFNIDFCSSHIPNRSESDPW